MNGWTDAPTRFWWRFVVLPFGWDECRPLGWWAISFFGFTFFFDLKLTKEQEEMVKRNNKKMLAWVEKHGQRID
jgi:hypothetical protein